MEALVDQFARIAGSFVEAVAVLTVAYGSVEAFIVEDVLSVAFLPYLRGLVNRIARIWVHPQIAQS